MGVGVHEYLHSRGHQTVLPAFLGRSQGVGGKGFSHVCPRLDGSTEHARDADGFLVGRGFRHGHAGQAKEFGVGALAGDGHQFPDGARGQGGKLLDREDAHVVQLGEAIQLDMLDSQIGRALKYTMDPTLLMLVPSAVPMMAAPVTGETTESAGQTPTGQGMAKTPSTVLTMDAEGDAKYLEIAGGGIEA